MTQPAPDQVPNLLTVAEVCEALHVRPDWLYDQVQAKRVRAVKLGRRSLRFRPADIRAFVDSLAEGGEEL